MRTLSSHFSQFAKIRYTSSCITGVREDLTVLRGTRSPATLPHRFAKHTQSATIPVFAGAPMVFGLTDLGNGTPAISHRFVRCTFDDLVFVLAVAAPCVISPRNIQPKIATSQPLIPAGLLGAPQLGGCGAVSIVP